jgi:flavin reductase (DIM6/NTAB) family NADH-FMN oxidoreductase RutF
MVHVVDDRLDEATLRRAFGCFPSGVIALCAMLDGQPVGMAASSFTPVSLDPPLVSICIQNGSTTWPRLRQCARLGVSVLAEGHDKACLSLSRKEGDRFAGVSWLELASGGVIVKGASAWLNCRLYDEIPAGDHHLALLEIRGLQVDLGATPLVYLPSHGSRFRRLAKER